MLAGHGYTAASTMRPASGTRSAPEMSLGRSVFRRAARVLASLRFCADRSNRGLASVSNAARVHTPPGSTTGSPPIASGRTAGYAPPSASLPSSSPTSGRVRAAYRKAQLPSRGESTANPVDTMSVGCGCRHKKCAPRSGLTVDRTVSPCLNRRRARLGSAPFSYRAMFAISPFITSLIST